MYRKYPRTQNLWFSQSNSSDDVWLSNSEHFSGKEVIISEKLDGQCTTLYPDGKNHARSIDSMHSHHPSRSYIKATHAGIVNKMPKGIRVCGEDLYAQHLIKYSKLPAYFFCYAIFNEQGMCISWKDTQQICQNLSLQTVPVLYNGIWDETLARRIFPFKSHYSDELAEGFVVRLADSFPESEFKWSVAKYVRKNFAQNITSHWMLQPVIPNKLTQE
jgi:hypothetical protein